MKNRQYHMNTTYNLTMKRFFAYHHLSTFVKTIPIILLVIVCANVGLMAQNRGSSATQSVTLEVKPIAKISVAGYLTPLIINDATPGSDLASVSDENSKYSLVTNVDNMKIVASISDRMPAGTRLMIKLGSSKAASAGMVDLSSALTPVDVVRGIRKGSDVDQSISYTFAANSEVDDIPSQSRMITLTLTN
jgi:hypothetical protein